MRRLAVVLVLGLFLVPCALPAGAATRADAVAPVVRLADADVIEGKVTGVDYTRGVVTVDSAKQGKVDVATMPSTSVQSDEPGYHTLTDVTKGAKVQIFIAKTAGKLVAQIIRLVHH